MGGTHPYSCAFLPMRWSVDGRHTLTLALALILTLIPTTTLSLTLTVTVLAIVSLTSACGSNGLPCRGPTYM